MDFENQMSLFNMLDSICVEEVPKTITEEKVLDNEEVLTSGNEEEDKEHYIGEQVTVSYDGVVYPARVTRIYNDGYTLNCIFDGKSTAFHKSAVYTIVL